MEQANTILKEVSQNLAVIAGSAGVVVEHLWKILTKQQVLYGVQQFLTGSLFIGIGVFLSRVMDNVKHSKMAALDKKSVIAIAFVAMIIVLFWGASVMVDSLPRLFNPEYYSIKEAVDMLQKVRR